MLALLLVASPALAADEGRVLRLRAEQLAADGRCEEALPVLRRARSADPTDARAALLEGECLIRQGDYVAAIVPLTDARRLDPELGEAALYLGVAAFHAGDLDTAGPALEDAVRLLPNNAQAHLYHGLVLLDRAQATEAAASLERASTLDPSFDPVASYFAGRAWQAARERRRAEKSLKRVVAEAPGTSWADEAERALESGVGDRPSWVSLSGGFEYNTNVVLQGTGVVPAGGISNTSDWAGVWALDTGTELFRNDDWAGGAAISYFASAYGELSAFDVQFPSAYLWLDRALGESSFLRLTADSGYAWVGYDPYLLPIGTTLSLHHRTEKAGSGRAYFRWARNDYKFAIDGTDLPPVPPGVTASARDQDGNWYLGGYDHRFSVSNDTALRGGVSIGHYDSNLEYTNTAYQAWIGARQELPCEMAFDGFASYTRASYANPSTFRDPNTGFFPGQDRRDNIYQVGATLERYLTDRLVLSARYRYVNDDSNTRVYRYDQHVVGGYLTFELGPTRARTRFDYNPSITDL